MYSFKFVIWDLEKLNNESKQNWQVINVSKKHIVEDICQKKSCLLTDRNTNDWGSKSALWKSLVLLSNADTLLNHQIAHRGNWETEKKTYRSKCKMNILMEFYVWELISLISCDLFGIYIELEYILNLYLTKDSNGFMYLALRPFDVFTQITWMFWQVMSCRKFPLRS